MNPYAHVKIWQLQEERFARCTVSCAPRPFLLARSGLRRLMDVLSGPTCVAHG